MFFLEGARDRRRGGGHGAPARRDVPGRSAPDRAGGEARGLGAARSRGAQGAPLLSLPVICQRTGLSFPAASSAIDLLLERGIARELTGQRRDRLFLYDRYLAILNDGTEPL